MNYPKKVTIGDITVRDGFQHEEKFIPTEAKLWLAEELLLCGFKHIEVTNYGNPKGMPQFKDADDTRGRIVMACMTPAAEGTRISIDDPESMAFRAAVITASL